MLQYYQKSLKMYIKGSCKKNIYLEVRVHLGDFRPNILVVSSDVFILIKVFTVL